MKTLIVLIALFIALIVLTGCDAMTGYNMVKKTFPNAEVVSIPGESYKFVVRDTNQAIWFVRSDGFGPYPDAAMLLPAPNKK